MSHQSISTWQMAKRMSSTNTKLTLKLKTKYKMVARTGRSGGTFKHVDWQTSGLVCSYMPTTPTSLGGACRWTNRRGREVVLVPPVLGKATTRVGTSSAPIGIEITSAPSEGERCAGRCGGWTVSARRKFSISSRTFNTPEHLQK